MNATKLRLFTLVIGISAAAFAFGQESRAVMLLDLKQIHSDYELAKDNYDRASLQLTTGSITKDAFRSWEVDLLRAEINYQKHLLRILSQSIYLTVQEAVKYTDPNGQPRVAVRIRSVLQGDQEYLAGLNQAFAFSPVEFQPDRVYDVYVSLADLETNMIISKPYEEHVPAMEFGKEVLLDFALLRDVEGLQVIIAYLGRSESKRIWLEREAGSSLVSINSSQFSQDADLGGEATFDITLERITQREEIVQLVVINLPRQITYEIYETGSRVRSSQMKFTPAVTSKELALRAHLPDRANDRIIINQSLEFYVAAVPQSNPLQIDRNRMYDEAELGEMSVGMVKLELYPRGTGHIDINAPNLYFESTSGEGIETEVHVKNDGTIPLVNVRVISDAPGEWIVNLDPYEIEEMAPGREQRIVVSLHPTQDVGIGAQELTIRAEALADGELIESDRRTLRIVIKKEMAVGTIALLAALIVVVVSAIIVFGVRISRR